MNKIKDVLKAIYVTAAYLVAGYALIVAAFFIAGVLSVVPGYASLLLR